MPQRAGSEQPVTVMVTGAAGFVGMNLFVALAEAGHRVVGLDTNPLPPAAVELVRTLPAAPTIELLDVRDQVAVAEVFHRQRPDAVIHAATITAAPERERLHAREIVDVNVGGTQAVLDACTAAGVRRLVYVSSGAVYGDLTFGGEVISEESRVVPTSLYGITKLAGEQLVRRHGQLHDLETVSARLSAAFGPWEYPTGSRDLMSPLLQLALAGRRGDPSRYVADADRNWISVTDAVTVLVGLALGGRASFDCYNVCPPVRFGVERWIRQLRRAYPTAGFESVSDPADATISYDADPRKPRAPVVAEKIEQEVGSPWWSDPDDALNEYLMWLQAHPEWA